MAYAVPGRMITLPASTTIVSSTSVSYQFRMVNVNTSGQATLATTVGGSILGVLQNKPSYENEAASVMLDGVTKVLAHGSTCSVGELVACSSVGMVQATTAGAFTVGTLVAGSSGSTGRVLTMALTPIGTT